jgi:hypothetical protein
MSHKPNGADFTTLFDLFKGAFTVLEISVIYSASLDEQPEFSHMAGTSDAVNALFERAGQRRRWRQVLGVAKSRMTQGHRPDLVQKCDEVLAYLDDASAQPSEPPPSSRTRQINVTITCLMFVMIGTAVAGLIAYLQPPPVTYYAKGELTSLDLRCEGEFKQAKVTLAVAEAMGRKVTEASHTVELLPGQVSRVLPPPVFIDAQIGNLVLAGRAIVDGRGEDFSVAIDKSGSATSMKAVFKAAGVTFTAEVAVTDLSASELKRESPFLLVRLKSARAAGGVRVSVRASWFTDLDGSDPEFGSRLTPIGECGPVTNLWDTGWVIPRGTRSLWARIEAEGEGTPWAFRVVPVIWDGKLVSRRARLAWQTGRPARTIELDLDVDVVEYRRELVMSGTLSASGGERHQRQVKLTRDKPPLGEAAIAFFQDPSQVIAKQTLAEGPGTYRLAFQESLWLSRQKRPDELYLTVLNGGVANSEGTMVVALNGPISPRPQLVVGAGLGPSTLIVGSLAWAVPTGPGSHVAVESTTPPNGAFEPAAYPQTVKELIDRYPQIKRSTTFLGIKYPPGALLDGISSGPRRGFKVAIDDMSRIARLELLSSTTLPYFSSPLVIWPPPEEPVGDAVIEDYQRVCVATSLSLSHREGQDRLMFLPTLRVGDDGASLRITDSYGEVSHVPVVDPTPEPSTYPVGAIGNGTLIFNQSEALSPNTTKALGELICDRWKPGTKFDARVTLKVRGTPGHSGIKPHWDWGFNGEVRCGGSAVVCRYGGYSNPAPIVGVGAQTEEFSVTVVVKDCVLPASRTADIVFQFDGAVGKVFTKAPPDHSPTFTAGNDGMVLQRAEVILTRK